MPQRLANMSLRTIPLHGDAIPFSHVDRIGHASPRVGQIDEDKKSRYNPLPLLIECANAPLIDKAAETPLRQ